MSSIKPGTAHAREEMHAHAQRIADALALMEQCLPVRRRMLRAGDTVTRPENTLPACVIHSGFFKLVSLSADGREQVVALHFKGDWLGFDGIASGQHGCDAVKPMEHPARGLDDSLRRTAARLCRASAAAERAARRDEPGDGA